MTPPEDDTRLSRRAWGLLLVLCGALFLDALDVSMTGVALPAIGADLGMTNGELQWVMSGYVLGFGGFLLLGGRVADLFGGGACSSSRSPSSPPPPGSAR